MLEVLQLLVGELVEESSGVWPQLPLRSTPLAQGLTLWGLVGVAGAESRVC